jgi:hypothetical protein
MGTQYYYCAHTGVTTWERPTAATSDSTAATSDSTAASSDIARGIASCTSDGVAGSGSDTERRAHEWNRQVGRGQVGGYEIRMIRLPRP